MVRQLAKAPWWAWSVLSVAVIALVLLAVTGLSLWPRAEAQLPDPDPQPVVYLSASNYTVGEGDGQMVITVLLSAASSQTVTVDYATADGTATANEDYVPVSGTLVFAPGETSKTIVIMIIENTCCEESETFTVDLFNPDGASLGTPSTSTVTILDDDACP